MSNLSFLPLVTTVGNHEPFAVVYRDVYEAHQIQYRRFLKKVYRIVFRNFSVIVGTYLNSNWHHGQRHEVFREYFQCIHEIHDYSLYPIHVLSNMTGKSFGESLTT